MHNTSHGDRIDGRYTVLGRHTPSFSFNKSMCFHPVWLPLSKQGYAQISVKTSAGSRHWHAHRLAAALFIGPKEHLDCILHRCGVRGCCNFCHLYPGDAAQNSRDEKLHRTARQKFIALDASQAVTNKAIYREPPFPLSEEISTAPEFKGFSPNACTVSPWLHPTVDGYVQLEETDACGDVCGAHRLSYQLFVGRLSKYDIIEQTCNNKHCINPYHLRHAGAQPDRKFFDFMNDKRRTVSPAIYALILDADLTDSQVAILSGIHIVTVGEYRRRIGRLNLKKAMQ
jgi:hypothetical protein